MRGRVNDISSIDPANNNATAQAFISYSSHDSDVAHRLLQVLEQNGISARIDTRAIQGGEDIREFILESIRTTRATIWIVSKKSLQSDWVALEILSTLQDAELWGRSLFPCYLDREFFEASFLDDTVKAIDGKLEDIFNRYARRHKGHLGTDDIDDEKKRLIRHRDGLSKVIAFLKAHRCIDIGGKRFAAGVAELVRAMSPNDRAVVLPLAMSSDVTERREEVYRLFRERDPDRAMDRMMDFVHDFGDQQETREATAIHMSYGDLKEEVRGARQRMKLRKEIVIEALKLVDEVADKNTPPKAAA